MPEEVQQDDPIPAFGQGPCERTVQIGVEEQAVEVDDEVIALAVHLVGEAVAGVNERRGYRFRRLRAQLRTEPSRPEK